MQFKIRFICILIGCFSTISCAQSKTEIVPKTYIAYKALEEIKIDGDDSDISWSKAQWSEAFIDIEGVKKPTYNTQVKMLWDETYFYILAKLEEPHVWANLKQRDTIIFYDNDFEIFIDPDSDTFNYYELELNALNTAWDLFVSKPYRETDGVVLNDWDINGLKSAIKVDGTLNNPKDIDKGWMIELALPWSAYKTSYFEDNIPIDKFWRVNYSRVNWEHDIVDGKYSRKKDGNGKSLHEYNWVWSPQGVINMHLPEKWGYVYFSSNVVGTTEDVFQIPNDEKIKWKLYQLYRMQKQYFNKNKKWATSIDELLVDNTLIVDNNALEPILENHSTGWSITINSPFSDKQLIIEQDGNFITK
ncbi:carbohydrate-binding family 9-like protein [Yeosuana sp. MJ-SS3]|uniref:Carbohydrate-binding family 9-like protein n=1 Tax=Gilvirhabdus luticola TaxID=3079858 RepID=A0ABU3U6I5_9FLAO|nr:carbohydrate-binding family 9-like protein [Yeosuana sp. MJ-SS3]MDU8886018.1 carbohydrate-binding family 9-like protein [Yeosuana sp. MJ-SS3]